MNLPLILRRAILRFKLKDFAMQKNTHVRNNMSNVVVASDRLARNCSFTHAITYIRFRIDHSKRALSVKGGVWPRHVVDLLAQLLFTELCHLVHNTSTKADSD